MLYILDELKFSALVKIPISLHHFFLNNYAIFSHFLSCSQNVHKRHFALTKKEEDLVQWNAEPSFIMRYTFEMLLCAEHCKNTNATYKQLNTEQLLNSSTLE